MSNSNFNITKVVVDPTSQEITNLEINGKAFESGSGEVEEVKTVESLDISDWFVPETFRAPIYINPSEGYDSIKKVEIEDVTGYPTIPDHLFVKKFIECDSEGEVVTGGHEYNGSITDTEYSEVEASVIYINDTKISVTSKKIDVVVPGGKDLSYYIYYWDNEGEWIMIS